MQDEGQTTGDYFESFFQNIVDGLPAFLGALAVLLVSYFVAKSLEKIVRNLLGRVDFDNRLHSGAGGQYIQRAAPNPAGLIGQIVYWIVLLFGISIAISVLGIPLLNDLLQGIYGYLPNVIVALIIFMVASALSAGVVGLVQSTMGNTATGKIVSTATPIVIMSIATFMILNQLRIAPEIVTITYAALIGSAALGMALAFGLGGRQVAGNILENLYKKGQESKNQARKDIKQGAKNAQQKARKAAK